MEDILNIMVAQHGLVEAMLFVFKDELKQGRKMGKQSLAEMEWEIKKHFFIEEAAIFDYLPFADSEISKLVEHIKKEHTEMLAEIAKMWKEFPKSEGFEVFYAMLRKHRELEEQKLYPLLDKRLTEAEKSLIVARVNEIPFKK